MALLFCEGFDKYGAANSNSTVVAALLTAGEWTSSSGTSHNIVAPLSATGNAVQQGSLTSITKTLSASYGRLIGGVRFNATLVALTGIQFYDAATGQCGIAINTNGTIAVRNGVWSSGTILGTSTASISANTTHYLEFDITFGNSANYQLWLDGVSILSGTGDTTATVNNTASGIAFGSMSTGVWTIDDFYLFDATGTTNNAVLLTSPRIETQFPSADSTVQFAVGAATLGNSIQRSTGNWSPGGAGAFYLRPYIPAVACTLNSICVLAGTTSASLQLRPIVYADVAGVPTGGALLSTGAVVTGVTTGVVTTMPLTTPQALTAGTRYWLGFMEDLNVGAIAVADGTNSGRSATGQTFASGAPATCPATSGGSPSLVAYGGISVTGNNWYEVASQPVQGAPSYVYDATVGHEDLYSFPSLSVPPTAIYAVAVKANLSKSDAGAKTASVRLKSGATDSAGTGGTALAPGTTYGWMTSHFERDPNGSIAWTQPNLNAAQAGVKVES